MKFIVCIVATIVVIGALASTEAAPQRVRVQKLPYYPPPRRPQPPIRVRRQSLNANAAPAGNGGIDGRLSLSKVVANDKQMAIGEVFAQGNSKGGPVTTGGSLGVNSGPLSASISKTNTPGVQSVLSKSAGVNLLNTGTNRLDANVFKDTTKQANGFSFDREGGSLSFNHADRFGASISKERIPGIGSTLTKSAQANLFNNGVHRFDAGFFDTKTQFSNGLSNSKIGGDLGWSHMNGHKANLGLTNFNGFGKQLSLGAGTNLYTSPSGNTQLGVTGGASRWLDGPLKNQNDFNLGVVGRHYFFG